MSERTKFFQLRISPSEHKHFSDAAKSLGLTMSQLMRILMQADIAKCGAIDATILDENNVLVIRFVEEKSLRDLSDKNRRIGNLLNQATRALNDLRNRKSMSANYVAERLLPIWEKVSSVYDRYQDYEEDWARIKLFLMQNDLKVIDKTESR